MRRRGQRGWEVGALCGIQIMWEASKKHRPIGLRELRNIVQIPWSGWFPSTFFHSLSRPTFFAPVKGRPCAVSRTSCAFTILCSCRRHSVRLEGLFLPISQPDMGILIWTGLIMSYFKFPSRKVQKLFNQKLICPSPSFKRCYLLKVLSFLPSER